MLIFKILQRKIWAKSENDIPNLNAFYEKNMSNYTWEKRIKASIVSCKYENIAKKVLNYLNEGNQVENIKKDFTINTEILEVKSGIFEQESLHLPKIFELNEWISKIYQ